MGSIRSACDHKQRCCLWRIYGHGARVAAGMLASMESIKKPQLQIIASERPTCHDERVALAKRLRSLKQSSQQIETIIGWSYLAGFFDAEGCIHFHTGLRAGNLVYLSEASRGVACDSNVPLSKVP